MAVGLALWGAVIDPVGAASGEPLRGPLSDGFLLGSDGDGRDVLQLAAAGLARAAVGALVPALAAVVVAAGLVALQRRLGSVGVVVPGAAIDGLWWPLPIIMVFAASTVGGPAGLLEPVVLALVATALIPPAARLLNRDPITADGGGLVRLSGVWLLVGAMAALASLVAAYAGADGPASLGGQLATGADVLDRTVWPVAVPSAVALAGLFILNGTGSALVNHGWLVTARRLTAEADLDVAGDTLTIPLAVDEPVDGPRVARPSAIVPLLTEPDDGPLGPNYSLQPGLPRPAD